MFIISKLDESKFNAGSIFGDNFGTIISLIHMIFYKGWKSKASKWK